MAAVAIGDTLRHRLMAWRRQASRNQYFAAGKNKGGILLLAKQLYDAGDAASAAAAIPFGKNSNRG